MNCGWSSTPVYTQGLAGKPEHLLHATAIPVVKTDRGGQITYHGPGQLVVYLLVDFKRMGIGVRELVRRIEQAVIDTLAELGIHGNGDVDAPAFTSPAPRSPRWACASRTTRSTTASASMWTWTWRLSIPSILAVTPTSR